MSNYTVMTLNLWCDFMHIIGTKGFAHRIRSIETIIDQYRPDIIGMQEMTSAMVPYMEEKILKEYGMFGAHRRSLMNNEANPILYRKDRFEFKSGRTLWLSKTPEVEGSRYLLSQFPRIVTIVTRKDRESGELLTFANTHLDVNFSFIRKKQAETLCRILEKEKNPVCLSGDFNSESTQDSIQTILHHGFQDCAADEFSSTLRGKIGSARFHWLPIGHIFHNSRFHMLHCQKITDTPHGIWPSDHYPLLAYLETDQKDSNRHGRS